MRQPVADPFADQVTVKLLPSVVAFPGFAPALEVVAREKVSGPGKNPRLVFATSEIEVVVHPGLVVSVPPMPLPSGDTVN
jgi:hypothetical protein